jgi:putative transposase
MLQTPDANLSSCMRHLNGVYTQKHNVNHGCDGTLFRGRYKSILVGADSYVLQLIRYIQRNPLKAGLVKRLNRYAWSSHKGYISTAKKWSWLYKDFVLQMLTEQVSSQIPIYKQFVAQQQDKDFMRIIEREKQPSMLGSNEFISWVKDRFFKKKIDKEIPALKVLAPDTERIISEVNRHYEASSIELTAVRRGIENEPRDVAIYLIRSMRSDPLMRIGARFGLTQYSSVSSVVLRVKTKLQKDKGFKERLAYVESEILKSQT